MFDWLMFEAERIQSLWQLSKWKDHALFWPDDCRPARSSLLDITSYCYLSGPFLYLSRDFFGGEAINYNPRGTGALRVGLYHPPMITASWWNSSEWFHSQYQSMLAELSWESYLVCWCVGHKQLVWGTNHLYLFKDLSMINYNLIYMYRLFNIHTTYFYEIIYKIGLWGLGGRKSFSFSDWKGGGGGALSNITSSI